LHAILKTSKNFEYYVDGQKRIYRPGIVECRTSMIMHVKSAADVDEEIAKMRETYDKMSLQVQPFVIAIGPTVSNVTEFLSIIGNLKFKHSRLQEAIDVCIKATFVFAMKYQKISTKVWRFFQQHFFMPIGRTKDSADIVLLSKSMKKS
jgi:hypothetical protein